MNIVLAIIEGLGVLLTVGGGVFLAGRLAGSVESAVKAIDKLTRAFEKFSDATDGKLVDHEVRITVLERDRDYDRSASGKAHGSSKS